MTYQERFKRIIERMHLSENHERYIAINLLPQNSAEREIHEICQKLWGNNFLNKDMYNISDDLNPLKANKLLDRLEELLNQLGWE